MELHQVSTTEVKERRSTGETAHKESAKYQYVTVSARRSRQNVRRKSRIPDKVIKRGKGYGQQDFRCNHCSSSRIAKVQELTFSSLRSPVTTS
jgi:hypothetical protein